MADRTRTSSGFSQATSAPAASEASAGRTIADSAAKAATEAKKAGSELVGAVRDGAVSLLDAQRGRAADQIAAVGEALKRSAQSLGRSRILERPTTRMSTAR